MNSNISQGVQQFSNTHFFPVTPYRSMLRIAAKSFSNCAAIGGIAANMKG